jgi:hypothetical protein
MELKGSKMRTNEWRPNRVLVFEDRIEERDPGFLKTRSQTVRYEQVAQVAMKTGVAFSEITIETTGGGTIRARGLSKGDAQKAKELIDERVARARTGPAPAASSVADELAKLATLREQGVLSTEEFEAQKGRLLG